MQFIKQNDTAASITIGIAVDKTDGFTSETGLLASTVDAIGIYKAGATIITAIATTEIFESIANGHYHLTLASTHIDTVGNARVVVRDDSVCLPFYEDLVILDPDAFDALLATATTTGNLGFLDATISSRAATTDLTSTATDAIVALIWDEILIGSTHNINNSSGKRLRQVEQAFIHAGGTIATVTNGHTIVLDTGAVATTDFYIGDRLQITEGTGAGQSRVIVAYTSGRVATLDSNFTVNPNTSSLYEVVAADVHVAVSDADLAEGFVTVFTNTTTITLDAGAVGTTDFYIGELIIFTHGTGAMQAREITAYTSGRVVTMSPALIADLATDTTYHIQAAVSIPEIVQEVWAGAASLSTATTTFGGLIQQSLDVTVSSRATSNVGDFNNIAASAIWAEPLTANATATTLYGGLIQKQLDAAISSRATSNASDVWANVGDTATGPPPLAPTRAQQMDWAFTLDRNQTEQTADTKTVYGTATTVVLATAAVSDSGTVFTRGVFG